MKNCLRYFILINILFFYVPCNILNAQFQQEISSIKELDKRWKSNLNLNKMRIHLDSVKFYFDQIPFEDKQQVYVRKLFQTYRIHEAMYAKRLEEYDRYLKILKNEEQSIKLIKQRNRDDSASMSKIYWHLSAYHKRIGDSKTAKIYSYKANLWYKGKSTRLAHIAAQLLSKNEYSKAKEYALEALKYAKTGSNNYSAICHILCRVYIWEKNIDQAWHYLDLHDNNLSYDSSNYTVIMSQILRLENNFTLALNIINRQLKNRHQKFSSKMEYDAKSSELYIELGEIHFDLEEYDLALKSFQKSIFYLSPDLMNGDLKKNPVIKPFYNNLKLLNAFNKKIKCLYKLYEGDDSYLDVCLNTTITIIDLMDEIRENFMSDEDQHFLVSESYNNYKIAFELFIVKSDLLQAFKISERSKSITLYNKLKVNFATYNSLLEKDQSLNKINQLKTALLDSKYDFQFDDKISSKSIEAKENEIKLKLNSLNRELAARPEIKNILNQLEIVSFNKINKGLNNDQMMIHFFETDQNYYAFLFKKDKVLPKLGIIERSDTLKKAIENFNMSIYEKQDTFYTNNAHFIFKKLFYEPFIKEQGFPKELIITSDGALHNLAYDALLLKEAKKIGRFKDYEYFGTKIPWTSWYSASIGLNFLTNNSYDTQSYKLLTYAPKFEKEQADPNHIGNNTRSEVSLDNLIFSQKEVDTIKHILNYPDSLVLAMNGGQATKGHFFSNYKKAPIIHIATHGVALNSEDSYIAFSNIQDSIDYKLSIENIYLLNMSTDMVVTSACKTGLGQQLKGEGLISISRALMYAGSKSVVYSLWQVEDQSTMNLSALFYEELAKGINKTLSMRNAKKAFIKNAIKSSDAHPMYWAPLVLSGSSDPIINIDKNKEDNNRTKVLFGGLFVIILFMFFTKYYRIFSTD